MPHPILNLAEVELQPRPAAFAPTGPAAEKYEARMGQIGRRLGAEKLGYNLTVVPPGKAAFPFHNHQVNEEMFFILSGHGELRIGGATFALKPQDVVACPPGGPDTAHQIVNTGTEELRYLAVSTKQSPELVDYPKSGRFGLMAEIEGPGGVPRMMMFVGRESDSLPYWEDE